MLEIRMLLLKRVEKECKNSGKVVDLMKYYQLKKVNIRKQLHMQVVTQRMKEVKKMGVKKLL